VFDVCYRRIILMFASGFYVEQRQSVILMKLMPELYISRDFWVMSGDCFVIGALKVIFWDIRLSSHWTPAESLCLWIWRTVDWVLETATVVYCDRPFVAYLALYIAGVVFYIIQNHKISLCHLFIYNVSHKWHKLKIIVQRSPESCDKTLLQLT